MFRIIISLTLFMKNNIIICITIFLAIFTELFLSELYFRYNFIYWDLGFLDSVLFNLLLSIIISFIVYILYYIIFNLVLKIRLKIITIYFLVLFWTFFTFLWDTLSILGIYEINNFVLTWFLFLSIPIIFLIYWWFIKIKRCL